MKAKIMRAPAPTSAPPASITPEAHHPAQTRPARSTRSTVGFAHWWWALPGVLLIVVIHYLSTGIGTFFSFTNWSGIGRFEWVGLANFQRIFQTPAMVGALRNTIIVAIASVLLTNIAGLGLAVALNRLVKTRHALRTLFFMPVVLSPLAVSYIWKFIFEYNGPLNEVLQMVGLGDFAKAWLGDPGWALVAVLIVMVWQQTGFVMVVYMAGLTSVPIEIEEAAALDGTSIWQRFWHVVIPALRPAIAIATALGIINGLRIFDQIMALTGGGPSGATETLATQVYKQAFSLGNFGYGASLAVLLTIVIAGFTIVQQRVTRQPED